MDEQIALLKEAILAALSKNETSREFEERAKDQFADYISEEVQYDCQYSESAYKLKDSIKRISKKESKARKQVKTFRKSLVNARALSNHLDFNDSLSAMIHDLNNTIKLFESFHKYLQEKLRAYKTEWGSAGNSRRKKRSGNLAGKNLAKMIAGQYLKYFKQVPATGNARVNNSKKNPKRRTPYDLVCEAVNDFYNSEITFYARNEARGGIRAKTKRKKPLIAKNS
jgi:hypothetical protein